MFYPSSGANSSLALPGDSFGSFTCGIQIIPVINEEWRKMKWPITRSVCGNMSNRAEYMASCYTRQKLAQKCANTWRFGAGKNPLGPSQRVIGTRLTSEDPVTDRETTPLSTDQHALETTQITRSHIHACNAIIWTMPPLFFSPNSDAHMRTLGTQASLLSPKIPCSCFLSLRLCVFLCMPEFLFAFTFFFSPNRGKGKQKHNERIKGDYRLSEFWI